MEDDTKLPVEWGAGLIACRECGILYIGYVLKGLISHHIDCDYCKSAGSAYQVQSLLYPN